MFSSVLQSWVVILLNSLQNLWYKVGLFLPSLLGAVVVFSLGLMVSAAIGRIVEKLIYYLKVDNLLRKTGLELYLNRSNLELNSGYFFGKIAYWFVFLGFVLATSEILGFVALSSFIGEVLVYMPNVIVASLIIIASLVAANFLRELARASVLSARLHKGKFLGSLVWWIIFVFGLLVALSQLGVAVNIIETVVTGVIIMIALAGGLAFGLGGKEVAGEIVRKIKSDWDGH